MPDLKEVALFKGLRLVASIVESFVFKYSLTALQLIKLISKDV